jgi:hypothetical protein
VTRAAPLDAFPLQIGNSAFSKPKNTAGADLRRRRAFMVVDAQHANP